ncbi:phosphodiester glycosidase family protein [Jannaschia aquimarina]|uniref:Phosphodiester glycosidase domain-containing protein n=1 Tax=Jannaschia aquimarina TaxID=935700 RepID=A0A0D1ELH2_9RHOB|nr:phosphodiester glycosidase family protein [Jannaschia aquimarina]KIT16625.1 hypothetical protein jaqu_15920 [Jannaschia aquimarina]SNS93982.1 Predicted protein [Jannaschia aquimarina]
MIRAAILLAGALGAAPAAAQETFSFPRPVPQVTVPSKPLPQAQPGGGVLLQNLSRHQSGVGIGGPTHDRAIGETVGSPNALGGLLRGLGPASDDEDGAPPAADPAPAADPNHVTAIVSAPAAAPRPASPPSVALRTVQSGPVALQVVTLPNAARVEIVAPDAAGRKDDAGLVLLEIATEYQPDILISGGYLSAFVPPTALGLVRVGGRDISRIHRSWLTTAVFCTDGSDHLVRSFSPEIVEGRTDCLQAGPMVVVDGASRYPASDLVDGEARLADQIVIHTFLCEDAQGALVMGISGAATLHELGPALVDGLGCRQAMRLSGRETGGMYLRGIGLLENSLIALPSAIAVHGVSVRRPAGDEIRTGIFR